jgi:hypothetical protein
MSNVGSTLATSGRGSGVPWMWPHSTSVSMWLKCWFLHDGLRSKACEEDVAPEDRLKGEGESRCDGEPEGDSQHDGEPVGDSWRNGEPDRFIASAG